MNDATRLAAEKIRALEEVEFAAFADVARAAPAELARAHGIGVDEVGGATCTLAAAFDVLAWNRACGLGLRRPATEADVDAVIERFRAAGVKRFFLPLSPGALPAELPEWLTARGFRVHNRWAKLRRGASPPPEARSDFRIEEIGAEHAPAFGSLVARSFDWPEPADRWMAELHGRRGWRLYAAFDGAQLVATGALFLRPPAASFTMAATEPAARGRGGQSALLARRIRDAAAAGYRHFVVETAEPKPERDAPSFRNTQRFGFAVAYLRPNYLYDFGG